MEASDVTRFFNTESNGRIFIAADTHYIGDVKTYNNCITRLFAWCFRVSLSVNIDGTERVVNKKSYVKLLRHLGQTDATVKNIAQYTLFRAAIQDCTLSESGGYLRSYISECKKAALFKELATALSTDNTERAILMIGKGALVDTAYFDREGLPPSFQSDHEGLSSEGAYDFKVSYGAPLPQAACKANDGVVGMLIEFGARGSQIQMYRFERKITGVSRDWQLRFDPYYTSSDRDRYPRSHYRANVRQNLRVHTRDIVSEPHVMNFDLDALRRARSLS